MPNKLLLLLPALRYINCHDISYAHVILPDLFIFFQAVKLLEQHNWGGDNEQTKRAAEQAAQNYYTREYEGYWI